MADKEIGFVALTPTTRITFSIGTWKGRPRASIRKFVATDKYAGPTKSGMSFDGAMLVRLLLALRSLQSTVPSSRESSYISVVKTPGWEIRVAIIPPDEKNDLPSVDIREFVETPKYVGPTKAGVRFAWNKLRQFTELLEVLAQELGTAVSSEATLFPEIQPQWVDEARKSSLTEKRLPSEILDPDTLKAFPEEFLSHSNLDLERVELPPDELQMLQDRDRNYFVTDGSTFRRSVRNEVEGKFFLYAQLRAVTTLHVPKNMFELFKAVAGYEKFCRDLRTKLVRELEKRSQNRTLAQHIARETFDSHGLPYI